MADGTAIRSNGSRRSRRASWKVRKPRPAREARLVATEDVRNRLAARSVDACGERETRCAADRPRRSLRGARPVRCAFARAPGRAAHGPKLLLRRLPRRPHARRLGTRAQVRRPAASPAPAGPRRNGPARWASPSGARRTCAPAATTSRRRMALIGVEPTWDHSSGRVNGFKIVPSPSSRARGSTSRCASPASSAMRSRPRSSCSTAPCAPSRHWTRTRRTTRSRRPPDRRPPPSKPTAWTRWRRSAPRPSASSAPVPAPTGRDCKP